MRLLHIPVLEQLVQITCPPELARKLFAYCLEWGAMIARSGHAASVGNPGGAVWTIGRRVLRGLGGSFARLRRLDLRRQQCDVGHPAGFAVIDIYGDDKIELHKCCLQCFRIRQ